MSAERAVRWGILGTANIASKVRRAIERTAGAEAVAIASRDLGRARVWAKEQGIARAYGDYAELLADPEIDAVYIPLPPSMHHDWALRSAAAGKHVLCEKPLAANVQEAEAMANACERAGVQLMDGVMWVHHDRAAEMRDTLARGELGELRRVTSAFSFEWDEIPNHNIRVSKELAGGCLGDLGYYCARMTLWMTGVMPTRVFADARYYNDVEFNLSAMLWFPDDVMASFDNGFDVVMRQWVEVAGRRASLVCDDFVLPRSDSETRYWVHDEAGAGGERVVGPCRQEDRMIARFSEIVRTGRRERRWVDEALAVMRVCDALAQSARTGAPVYLTSV